MPFMQPFALLLLVGYISIMNQGVLPLHPEGEKIPKIMGFYVQTTMISVNTKTTTSIWTCLSTAAAAPAAAPPPSPPRLKRVRRQAPIVCQGRRRRSLAIKSLEMNDEISLMRSSLRNSVGNQPVSKEGLRTGKAITVWSTLYSTLDIYVTKRIPVTVSALCNVIGIGQMITNSCFIG